MGHASAGKAAATAHPTPPPAGAPDTQLTSGGPFSTRGFLPPFRSDSANRCPTQLTHRGALGITTLSPPPKHPGSILKVQTVGWETQVSMAGPPAVSGVRTLKRSPESGGRRWARALYLVPPAEEAGCVDVGVRLVFIVRHLDVVPHAVVHHLASAAQPAPALAAAAAAAAAATATAAAPHRLCPQSPAPSVSARTRAPPARA